jgi:hypothetical protein
MDRSDLAIGLALAVGLVLVAQLEALFESAGLPILSLLTWPIGYGSIILVAWYVWIRPIDF